MIVAVGGLRVQAWWHYPEFYWHSVRSLRQAEASAGCRLARVFYRAPYLFSLTAWDSRTDMKAFANRGSHLVAMQAAPRLAAAFRFHHYEVTDLPDVDRAYAAWLAAARPDAA